MQACKILIHITNSYEYCGCLNMLVHLSRQARVLIVCLSLYLLSYFVYVSSDDYDRPEQMHRLCWACSACICDKDTIFMSWLNYFICQEKYRSLVNNCYNLVQCSLKHSIYSLQHFTTHAAYICVTEFNVFFFAPLITDQIFHLVWYNKLRIVYFTNKRSQVKIWKKKWCI